MPSKHIKVEHDFAMFS